MRKALLYILSKTVRSTEIPTPIPNEAKSLFIDRASKDFIMAVLHPNLLEREKAAAQIWLHVRLNEARTKKETKEEQTKVNPDSESLPLF